MPREDLYGDADGRWVVLSHSDGLTIPGSIEMGGPGPHVPLPGPVHRLVHLGTLRDLGPRWEMIGAATGQVNWTAAVRSLYAEVRAARDPQ